MAVLKKGEKKVLKALMTSIGETLEKSRKEKETAELNQQFDEVSTEEKTLKTVEPVVFRKPSRAKKIVVPVVKETPKVYRTYEDYDFDDLQLYAGIDCLVTSGAAAAMFPEIISRKTLKVPNKYGSAVIVEAPAIIESLEGVEMRAHEFIIDLEVNGLQYDVEKNQEFSRRMTQEVAELEEKIFTQIGGGVNLDSGVQMAELLFGRLGLPILKITKTGEPATDGEALLELAGLDKLGREGHIAPDPAKQYLADLAKRKDINSAHNTFIRTYVYDFVKRDCRIHPSYNLFGTSSFRITGSDPNLTQLPRPKHGYNIRECFIVAKGCLFMAFDFSSAEVKILTALCKDPGMMKAIAEGYDFHSFGASQMVGVSYEEFIWSLKEGTADIKKKYKEYRQIAKILIFSLLYGSSAGGIAMQLNVTLERAEELMNLFFAAYPGLKKFMEESHKIAEWNQKVWTPFGQYKHEAGAHPVFKRTASFNAAKRNSANVRVQSTTSTLGLVVFTKINEMIKPLGAKCICTVYDSIEIECPIQHAAEVAEICFYCMNDWPVQEFDWLDLPIGADGEIGTSWGNAKHIDRGITQEQINAQYLEIA